MQGGAIPTTRFVTRLNTENEEPPPTVGNDTKHKTAATKKKRGDKSKPYRVP